MIIMKLIASFQVDHTNLYPGIYVSRTDKAGDVTITTFDIRMTAPNREPAIAQAAMHTLEHLIATFLRNLDSIKDDVVYVGPMGCLTGMYVIMKNNYTPEMIKDYMLQAMEYVINYNTEVPGTTPATCGNYLMHDLPMAKFEARRYAERLRKEFISEYPKKERPVSESGDVFFDA